MFGKREVILSEELPKEKVEGLRYLYIVIDSDFKVHYEFNNKGHTILIVHKSEINPLRIYKNLPKNLIRKCVSKKKNIIGVLQLWVYYTRDYSYGVIRALGIIDNFKGNKLKAILLLANAMDNFCKHYNIRFVQATTSVIPGNIMKRAGFVKKPLKGFLRKVVVALFRQTSYEKDYQ